MHADPGGKLIAEAELQVRVFSVMPGGLLSHAGTEVERQASVGCHLS